MKLNLFNSPKPLIMGILNITPDSFYDGGSYKNHSEILNKCNLMIEDGVDIIDIGAVSTRPGADLIDIETEKQRILPVLELVRKEFPEITISIDTYHSKIAKLANERGGDIINDISGGDMDPEMFPTIAKLDIPYIMMHMQGTPQDMQLAPDYESIIDDILEIYHQKIVALSKLKFDKIIFDPGFGFGKTLDHNYEMIKKLRVFTLYGYPLLVGFSRKSMINKVLKTTPEEALNGTTILNTIAIREGAKILRVHDVKEAVEVIKITEYIKYS